MFFIYKLANSKKMWTIKLLVFLMVLWIGGTSLHIGNVIFIALVFTKIDDIRIASPSTVQDFLLRILCKGPWLQKAGSLHRLR